MQVMFETSPSPEDFPSSDFITIITPDRIRKFVNKAYINFLKKQESELVGVEFTRDYSDEQKQFLESLIYKLTPSNPLVSAVQKIDTPYGLDIITWRSYGIFDKNGTLIEILNVGRYQNEHARMKKEREELLATLNAYRNAIDANIICTITDVKGVITYANENFCKVSKFSRKEIIGHTHRLVNSGHHPKSFFVDMWHTLTSGKIWVGEIKNKAKDGTYYWVNSVILPIMSPEDDRITGYLSLRVLINEQKEMEEKKSSYLRSLEHMLFTVSHEIRKPIATCHGLLNLMVDNKMLTDEERNEVIDHLLDSVKELDDYSHKLNEQIQNNIKTVY